MDTTTIALIASIATIVLSLVYLLRPKSQEPTASKKEQETNVNAKSSTSSAASKAKVPAANKSAAKSNAGSHHLMVTSLKGALDEITAVAVTPNGQQIAYSSRDRTIRITTVEPGFKNPKNKKLPTEMAGKSAGVSYPDFATALSFNADGTRLMACLNDSKAVRVYDVAAGKPLFDSFRSHESTPVWCGMSSDGRFGLSLAEVCESKSDSLHDLKVWDGSRGNVITSCSMNQLRNKHGYLSPDDRFIAATGFGSEVKIYEIMRNKGTGAVEKLAKAMDLRGHRKAVQDVSFAGDSKTMFTGAMDGQWKLWNIDVRYQMQEDPKCLLTGETGQSIDRVAISADAKTGAITIGSTLIFVDLESGATLDTIPSAHTETILTVLFTQDGKYAVTAADRSIKVWSNPKH